MALTPETLLWMSDGGSAMVGSCQIGDRVMGADGKPTTITDVTMAIKPMYEVKLSDGRWLRVTEDHLNQVWIKHFNSNGAIPPIYEEATLSTRQLLRRRLHKIDSKGHRRPLVWIQDCKPLEYSDHAEQLIDPYTVGALIGDGSMIPKAQGEAPVVLTAHENDWPTYEREIPYAFSRVYRDRRHPSVISRTVKGVSTFVSMHGLDTHGNLKKVPDVYLFGSVSQRLALLQGLMDTDGSCSQDGKSTFSSNSKILVENVMWLARSLGGQTRWVSTGRDSHFKCSVRVSLPAFRLLRKLRRQRPSRRDMLALTSLAPIGDQLGQCITLDNDTQQLVAGNGLIRTQGVSAGIVVP